MDNASVSVSGIKVEGTWEEVVEFARTITSALHTLNADEEYSDEIEEWEVWRPREQEKLEDEVKEKTADKASINEGKGEKKDVSPTEDAGEAVKNVAVNSPKEAVKNKDINGAEEELKNGAEKAARAVDSAGRKTMRKVEKVVYENIMTRLSPLYFDNQLISANIQRKKSMMNREEKDEFVFEVNINDDEMKSDVVDELEDSGHIKE